MRIESSRSRGCRLVKVILQDLQTDLGEKLPSVSHLNCPFPFFFLARMQTDKVLGLPLNIMSVLLSPSIESCTFSTFLSYQGWVKKVKMVATSMPVKPHPFFDVHHNTCLKRAGFWWCNCGRHLGFFDTPPSLQAPLPFTNCDSTLFRMTAPCLRSPFLTSCRWWTSSGILEVCSPLGPQKYLALKQPWLDLSKLFWVIHSWELVWNTQETERFLLNLALCFNWDPWFI